MKLLSTTFDNTQINTALKESSINSCENMLLSVFPLGCPTLSHTHHDVTRPALLLQLSKENALHNSSSLVENFMVQLTLQGLLDRCDDAVDGRLTSSYLFHVSPYSDGLLTLLGGEFTKVRIM